MYFGHNPKLVHVLNGGLTKWAKEEKKVTNKITNIRTSNYKSFEKNEYMSATVITIGLFFGFCPKY